MDGSGCGWPGSPPATGLEEGLEEVCWPGLAWLALVGYSPVRVTQETYRAAADLCLLGQMLWEEGYVLDDSTTSEQMI